MHRRRLLAALGVAAGSLFTSPSAADSPRTRPAVDAADDWTPEGDPFRSVAIGDRRGLAFPANDRSHLIEILNDAGRRRRIGLRVVADGRQRTAVISVPAGEYLRVVLREPADYAVTVAVDAGAATVRIPRERFDCNESGTRVVVGPERIDHVTWSTEVGCPGPEIAGAEIVSERGECAADGEADEASVALVDGAVRIDGRIRAPTPCHRATLRDVTLADGRLEVVVGLRALDGICVQCVGVVPYAARIEFEHDYPAEVVVAHASDGERVEVAREQTATETVHRRTISNFRSRS